MAKSCKPADQAYRFFVRLLDGPFSRARGQRRPTRVLEIRESQTLHDLHHAIFDAFDREEEHLYEFQLGCRAPHAQNARHYGVENRMEPGLKSAARTRISDLQLTQGECFFYWFDFGDDWMHEVRLEEIVPLEKGVRYPRIVKRQGDSPPQYPGEDFYEDDGEEDEDALEEALDEIGEYLTETFRKNRVRPHADVQRLKDILRFCILFCSEHLDEEYIGVCYKLVAFGACSVRFDRGSAESWAAAVLHAAGMVNCLDDPATEPHMKLADIASFLGIAKSTMENKSREIRKALDIVQLDPNFCIASLLADNPLVWMQPNERGIFVDLRQAPRAEQERAFEAGNIPWIPADHPERHKHGTMLLDRSGEADQAEESARQEERAPKKSSLHRDPCQGLLFDLPPVDAEDGKQEEE